MIEQGILNLPDSKFNNKSFVTGRFLKNHKPFNKGKKWDEYLSVEKQNKCMSTLHRNGRKNIGGWNRKSIVAVKNGKIVGMFSSISEAGNKLHICPRNINSVCNKKRKHSGGM